MNRIRIATVERGEIDPETGEFPMILATEGEASDGDILSIKGARFGESAPLQTSHRNDPTATLGTVSRFKRDLQSDPKKLRAVGTIEMSGEGPQADIRRDLAHMISKGHVSGISVRWEPVKFRRRTDLPSDHPAYVDREKETDWRKRYGMLHDEWRVMEGSIVAIQADPGAMIGRAEETDGEVSEFWRSMSDHTPERLERPSPLDFTDANEFLRAIIPVLIDEGNSGDEAASVGAMLWLESAEEREVHDNPVAETVNVAEPMRNPETEEDEDTDYDDIDALTRGVEDSFGTSVSTLIEAGFSRERILELVEANAKDEKDEISTLSERMDRLEAENAALRAEVASGLELGDAIAASSRATPNAMDVVRSFQRKLRKEHEELVDGFRATVEARRGAIQTEERKALVKTFRARLEELIRENGRVNGEPSTPPEDPEMDLRELLTSGRESHLAQIRDMTERFKEENQALTRKDLDEIRALIEVSVRRKEDDDEE